ncbi:MAG: threonine/serine dehydratase [Chloroflexi bacterium]|nr:threonine/serine dehydratase [Chloroflexota bacterium]
MSQPADAVTLLDVQAASRRIRPYVQRTPLERSGWLSQASGAEVWLKLECFQLTGSFKLRGALNALLSLDAEARAKGVLTASAGNHGLGVAQAAQLTGLPAMVVVPETASAAKVELLRQSGCTLILHGPDYDAAEAHAIELARARGITFVSAYDDPAVVAGGGTISLEILEEQPDADVLLVPAGGGGLISGVALAAKGLKPAVRVVGVQSTASPSLHAALAAGHQVPVTVEDSLADGLSGNIAVGSITVDLACRYVDEVKLVSEAEIAAAMRATLEHEHILIEGSAAVTVALLLRGEIPVAGQRVVLVLTGRNVAPAVLRSTLGMSA